MPITVKKLDAAKSQLRTAIKLFFSNDDLISTHTLVSAALTILHDHIPSDEVWKHDILLHYDTIFIKDEGRKLWAEKTREAANFFKHADRDLKAGKTELEFNLEGTKFHIMEAIQCVRIIEGNGATEKEITFQIFITWLLQNYPKYLTDKGKKLLPIGFYDFPINKKTAREAIELLERQKT